MNYHIYTVFKSLAKPFVTLCISVCLTSFVKLFCFYNKAYADGIYWANVCLNMKSSDIKNANMCSMNKISNVSEFTNTTYSAVRIVSLYGFQLT